MSQDTGIHRITTKEQYYTKDETAKDCVRCITTQILNISDYLWVEPSAGNGVFLKYIPPGIQSIGIDIDPKNEIIQKQDFLNWKPDTSKPILVFGNPPFGKQSSLAKKFIRHSCTFADTIAFILPRSFQKPSMFNSFSDNFHMVYSKDIPYNSFVVNSCSYDVPCIFQIWKKLSYPRHKEKKIVPNKYKYVKQESGYTFAIRRVGSQAGKCYMPGRHFNNQTHRFIQLDPDIVMYSKKITELINKHTFPSNTVGPRSISTQEINIVLNSKISSVIKS